MEVTRQCSGSDGGGNAAEIEKWTKMRDTHEVIFLEHGDGLDLGRGGRGQRGK